MKNKELEKHTEKLNFKRDKTKYIKDKIKVLINQGDPEEASKMIDEIKKDETVFDIDIICAKIIILILENKVQEAKELSEKYINIYPFHFDLLCNRAYIYELLGDYQKSIDTYIKALKVADRKEDKEDITGSINRIKSLEEGLNDLDLYKVDSRMFPLMINQKQIYIGEGLFKNENSEGYFPQYYNETTLEYPVNMWNYYKTETLCGKKYNGGEYETVIKEKSVLPISYKDNIKIYLDDKEYEFKNIAPNRYNYFTIEKDTKVKIESKEEYILGNPIELEQKNKNDVKLVLCLFIDGLSQELLEEKGLKDIMPNTYKFFSKGSIFNNFYSNSEWTLPSVASVFSGRHQTNHGIFHPELPHVIGEGYPIMSEYFKGAGYLTFQVCGDWRKAPTYGYAKGFDRTIYQQASEGMRCENIIQAFLEQMRGFPNRDKFMWLSFFELHHLLNNLPDISNQIYNSIESHDYTESTNKSVFKSYDEKKIERYINELKRIDFYIKIIYNFIEENYKDNEILVTLLSDHGQSHLSKDDYILGEYRTHVPFMIRGKDVPVGISDINGENIDILPTLLEKADISFDGRTMDGSPLILSDGFKDKKYTYSESRFPDRTYKAIVRDKEYEFKFETKNKIMNDGRIDIDDFEYVLYDKNIKKIASEDKEEEIKKYLDIVMDHIKYNIKI